MDSKLNLPNIESNVSIEQLIDDIDNGSILIPNFQRDFVWDYDQQKKFLASILSGVPCGAMLLFDSGNSNDLFFTPKKLCYKKATNPSYYRGNYSYLLDGQQRLATLYSQFNDIIGTTEEFQKNHTEIYQNLKNRWYINLNEGQDDIWGLRNFEFKVEKLKDPQALRETLEYEKIFVTIERKGHPKYKKNLDKNPATAERKLAKKFAEEELIPLWDKKLMNKVLKFIKEEKIRKEKENNPEKDEDSINNKGDKWEEDFKLFIQKIKATKLPLVKIKGKEDEWARAISIFENLNRGGVPLALYDLVVARYSKPEDKENLTQN